MRYLKCFYGMAIFMAGTAHAEPRIYEAEQADQFLAPLAQDIVPEDAAARSIYIENLAFDAAIFGRVAVLTYNQIYDQAIDRTSGEYVGFNRFAHDRNLAGPGYKPFKTPNADTLYSNAYLDLRDGPVLLTVPPTDGRYYTVNFLDLFGNATNISARTHGTEGGRYLIAPVGWEGPVPKGVELFRVTQPIMWILMRIEAENPAAVPTVIALQDRFVLMAPKQSEGRSYPVKADVRAKDAVTSLTVLDWIVRNAGIRKSEVALVSRFKPLGVDASQDAESALVDPVVRAAADIGFAKAEMVLSRTVSQNGRPIAGNWREPDDIGRYGFNYLYRANVNSLGTGANVRLENFAFTTFQDASGEMLDGSQHDYTMRMETAPPADFFWSVTVYDSATQELFPNERNKYLVSDNTEGLEIASDGSITIRFAKDASGSNGIPIPAGPFYLALRAQGPREELRDGTWVPSPLHKDK